jgi:hypothetical protein
MLRAIGTRMLGRVAVIATVIGLGSFLAGSALANVPLTQISQDPFVNRSSFHRTQVEPDTFSFGATIISAFQSGRFYDGGASDIGFSTSTNSGATWTDGFLPGTTVFSTPPGPYARISDPSVAYDAADGVWMITGLAIDSNVVGKAVLVSRSTDGGLTWDNPVTVALAGGFSFFDKEWIACDNTASSPNFGNCYVEWDDAGNGGTLHMRRSTNGGQGWHDSTVPNNLVIGGQPLVQPNGTVVVPIDGGPGIQSFVSSNGGVSYTGPFTVASISEHQVAGSLRTSALPSAEIDGAGKVYVVWQDCRFRTNCRSNDIVMSTSTDGKTWSPVARIPIDATSSTVDHFIPGIAVDPATSKSTAHLGVAYYFYPKASCSSSTCKLAAGFISSTNGGQSWSAPVRVLGPLGLRWLPLTNQGFMVGDYISTSFSNGRAFPVIAGATQGNCQQGNVTSCHEFMVTATGGLLLRGGNRPAGTGRPVFTGRGAYAVRGLGTRF